MIMDKNNYKAFMTAIFISLLGVLFRVIVGLKKNYFATIDTYFYLENIVSINRIDNSVMSFLLNNNGLTFVTFILLFIMFMTFILFFLLAKKFLSNKSSLIALTMFVFSPLVFINTQMFMYDKNILSLYFIMAILVCIIYKFHDLFTMFQVALLMLVWKGGIIMFGIFCLYLFLHSKSKISKAIYFVPLAAGIYIASTLFPILNTNKVLIQETRYLWQTYFYPEYMLFIFIIFLGVLYYLLYKTQYLKSKHKPSEGLEPSGGKYLFGYFVIMFIASLYMWRMLIFLLPVLYIVFVYLINKVYPRFKWIFYIGVGLLFFISFPVYFQSHVTNDAMVGVTLYANGLESDCLIGDWGKGHIYNFYSDKRVLYRGSAGNIENQIDYMLKGNETDCILIWEARDVISTKYAADMLGITYPNPSYIETLDSYKVHDSKNNTFNVQLIKYDEFVIYNKDGVVIP